jgi:ribosome-binding protein aMBF1 (putative translation factor)
MGILVAFPRAHERISVFSRAANSTNTDGETPADLALSVAKIEDHKLDGMLSRCHHLETVSARARTSKAMASREGHSSITSRKDRKSGMPAVIGPFVLKRKDKVALDGIYRLGHNVRMPDDSEDQFKQEFIERVKAARIATGKKQWQVAELLNVPQDHYKHWEKTRLMPHHLVGRFCIVTNVDPNWLMTGRGAKPLKPLEAVPSEPHEVPKPKRLKKSKAA